MRIAVIGDVHLAWGERDVASLDGAGYDLALFVGDLAGYGSTGAVRVARSIATLRTPALVIPGNHDAVTVPQLALRGGGERTWHVHRDGIHYVNAACVPRTRHSASREERHHVRLTITDAALRVEPVWLAT